MAESIATTEQSTTDIARDNFRYLVTDIGWFGLGFPAIASFLSVYAIRLDAPATLLGLLAALPAIVALVTSSFAGWWAGHFSSTVRALCWPAFAYRMTFLLPAFTPFLPDDWQPIWLVIAVAVPATAQGIASVLFLVVLREGTPNDRITALMSRRSLLFNVMVGFSTLALGLWLEHVPFPINYQIMFVAAFAFTLMSWRYALKIRPIEMPDSTPIPALNTAIAPDSGPITDQPPEKIGPWRSPNFRRVALFTVMTHISLFLLAPIVPLWLVDELGANEGFMSVFVISGQITAAITSALTGQIVARIGSQSAITIGMIGTGIAVLLMAAIPNLYVTLPASALAGGMWTLAAISLFGYFSDNAPQNNLTRYTTVYNQVVMLSIFVGPMVGSQLASLGVDLAVVLVIGGTLRIVSGTAVSAQALRRHVRSERLRLRRSAR